MSVTTRTNLCTNPSAASTTNWGAYGGVGGTAALSNQSSGGAFGSTFNRATWSAATTSPSGGLTYTEPSGLAANQTYAIQMWVRSSKAQTIGLTAQFLNASSAVVSTAFGANVNVAANTWTQLTVTGTSGAAVTQVKLTAQPPAGSPNWASGDTLDGDGICIETGSTVGTYFDGAFFSAASVVYAWTGAANASASTAKTYTPAIALTGYTDANPCPRVGVTITDLAPSTCSLNVWRTADGDRTRVRSAEGISVVGSTFITDYETPLGRAVQYDIEVLTGISAGAIAPSQTVTLTTDHGWIQDPLVPNTAIPVYGQRTSGQVSLKAASVKNLEYAAGVNLIPILGSAKPVALLGQVLAAANVPYSLFTSAAEQSAQLRDLLQQTPLLLIRSLPGWGDALPGLVYSANAKAVEQPFPRNGQDMTLWQLTVNSVASPRLNILVPIWSYGDVQNLWPTYQAAQTTFAAKTYLAALQSPTGV